MDGREADEGQAEDEGQEDLKLEGAGQLARPDEDDGEGADAQLGEDVDGRDGLPAGVLSRLVSWVLSSKGRGEWNETNLVWARGDLFAREYRLGVAVHNEGRHRPQPPYRAQRQGSNTQEPCSVDVDGENAEDESDDGAFGKTQDGDGKDLRGEETLQMGCW